MVERIFSFIAAFCKFTAEAASSDYEHSEEIERLLEARGAKK